MEAWHLVENGGLTPGMEAWHVVENGGLTPLERAPVGALSSAV